MKVWTAPYFLNSPWHKNEHPGALLRLEYPGGQLGHADLHPWPELGDLTLQQHVDLLRQQNEHPRLARTLQLAAEDAAARSRGVSLVQGLKIPLSHRLLAGGINTSHETIQADINKGYRVFKLKMSLEPGLNQDRLAAMARIPETRWRLDFNGQPRFADFKSWWLTFNLELTHQLDGIEDPVCQADLHLLEQALAQGEFQGARLFSDRVNLKGAQGVVVKPEIQNWPEEHPSCVWVTNNLGHPLGHAVALSYAARYGGGEVAGLQGLEHYDLSPGLRPWAEQIRTHGPVTLPPTGAGFGFEELLNKTKWKGLA